MLRSVGGRVACMPVEQTKAVHVEAPNVANHHPIFYCMRRRAGNLPGSRQLHIYQCSAIDQNHVVFSDYWLWP